MPGLSTRTLAMLRGCVNGYMQSLAVIKRPALTPTGQGTSTKTYSDYMTNVKCWYAPLTQAQAEAIIGDVPTGTTIWRIRFADGLDVQVTDRIVVDGHTFEVMPITSGQTYSLQQMVYGVEQKA